MFFSFIKIWVNSNFYKKKQQQQPKLFCLLFLILKIKVQPKSAYYNIIVMMQPGFVWDKSSNDWKNEF